MLPPDGVAWPPEPAAAAPAPQVPELPPTVGRRPAGAEIADWRSLPVEAPHGYRGSATAPPTPTARIDPWSVVSFLAALLGVIPLLWSVPLAPVFDCETLAVDLVSDGTGAVLARWVGCAGDGAVRAAEALGGGNAAGDTAVL